jgi:hypothetical protein
LQVGTFFWYWVSLSRCTLRSNTALSWDDTRGAFFVAEDENKPPIFTRIFLFLFDDFTA